MKDEEMSDQLIGSRSGPCVRLSVTQFLSSDTIFRLLSGQLGAAYWLHEYSCSKQPGPPKKPWQTTIATLVYNPLALLDEDQAMVGWWRSFFLFCGQNSMQTKSDTIED